LFTALEDATPLAGDAPLPWTFKKDHYIDKKLNKKIHAGANEKIKR
jgi:hypothetical protein